MGYGYVGESQAAAAAQESFAGMAMAAMASSRVLSQGLNPSSSSNHPLGRVAVLGGRESLRDVIGSAYPADQRDLREGRGGGSFVAYVGGDSRLHSHGGGGGSVSSIGLVRRGEEKWAGLGLIHHDREQARNAAPIRTLDVGSLQDRLIEVETGKNARENPHLGQNQQVQEEDSEGRLRSGQPGSSTCKECGNQAKKDCPHQRCRTCCKSRGFDCSTHIKSTWVPAAKRRERQAAEAAAAAAGQPRPTSKRNRALAMAALSGVDISAQPASAGTSPRSSDPSQTVMSMKGSFPAEIRATALFKCVKVTGIDESENEYAYQTTVKIGGHIFKGVLSDHGLDPASSSSSGLPDLQLGGRSLPTNSALMDPSGMYGTSDSGLLGGQFLLILEDKNLQITQILWAKSFLVAMWQLDNSTAPLKGLSLHVLCGTPFAVSSIKHEVRLDAPKTCYLLELKSLLHHLARQMAASIRTSRFATTRVTSEGCWCCWKPCKS